MDNVARLLMQGAAGAAGGGYYIMRSKGVGFGTAHLLVGLPVFVVGAAAIALLPGGIGAYPSWVNAVLILYGINYAGFGIFIWVVQTIMTVTLGLLSLFLIQRQTKLIKDGQKI